MKKYNEYKDSGIEWLGHVPKDWSLSRLKDVFNFKGGYAFASKDYSSDGVQLILIGNLYKNQLSLNRNPTYVDENFLATHSNFVVSKNDILISLT
ncbi:restriction endonuclease subunit S, partial [Tenacibaculum piscium]